MRRETAGKPAFRGVLPGRGKRGDRTRPTGRFDRRLTPMLLTTTATGPSARSGQLSPAALADCCLAGGDMLRPVHTVTPLACKVPFAPLARGGLIGGVVIVEGQQRGHRRAVVRTDVPRELRRRGDQLGVRDHEINQPPLQSRRCPATRAARAARTTMTCLPSTSPAAPPGREMRTGRGMSKERRNEEIPGQENKEGTRVNPCSITSPSEKLQDHLLASLRMKPQPKPGWSSIRAACAV